VNIAGRDVHQSEDPAFASAQLRSGREFSVRMLVDEIRGENSPKFLSKAQEHKGSFDYAARTAGGPSGSA